MLLFAFTLFKSKATSESSSSQSPREVLTLCNLIPPLPISVHITHPLSCSVPGSAPISPHPDSRATPPCALPAAHRSLLGFHWPRITGHVGTVPTTLPWHLNAAHFSLLFSLLESVRSGPALQGTAGLRWRPLLCLS